MRAALVIAALGGLGIAAGACNTKQMIQPRYAASAGQGGSITVTSKAFTEASRIPVDNTCDGSDLRPDLTFSSAPPGTKSLVLYLEDPDAPGGLFTHLIAFNLSPELTSLPSGQDLAPAGEAARFGLNDFGAVRYNGPCPPKGEGHRYRFRVVALDTMLKLDEGANRTQVDTATDGHLLGEGSLTGHFAH